MTDEERTEDRRSRTEDSFTPTEDTLTDLLVLINCQLATSYATLLFSEASFQSKSNFYFLIFPHLHISIYLLYSLYSPYIFYISYSSYLLYSPYMFYILYFRFYLLHIFYILHILAIQAAFHILDASGSHT